MECCCLLLRTYLRDTKLKIESLSVCLIITSLYIYIFFACVKGCANLPQIPIRQCPSCYRYASNEPGVESQHKVSC